MIKLGMLDFDTSHVVQFTKRINHIDIDPGQCVDGAKVVIGCPGSSDIMPERIPGFAKEVGEKLGVKLVDRAEEMIGKIDGLLLEGNSGADHLEHARPFLKAGIPCFIDKPLAWSTKDAQTIADLSAKHKAPVFSASSFRFDEDVVAVQNARAELGKPIAVEVCGPQNYKYKDKVPGWFFYGIHPVEALFALVGPGYQSVQYVKGEHAEHVTALWKNGAVCSVTATLTGDKPSGFRYYGEKGSRVSTTDGKNHYRDLVRAIVKFFETGKAPVDINETIETIRFIEDVNKAAGF